MKSTKKSATITTCRIHVIFARFSEEVIHNLVTTKKIMYYKTITMKKQLL